MIKQELIEKTLEVCESVEKSTMVRVYSTYNSGKTTACLLSALKLIKQGKKVCIVNYDLTSQEVIEKLVLSQNQDPKPLKDASFVLSMRDIPWERGFDVILIDGSLGVKDEMDLAQAAKEHSVFILHIIQSRC